MIDSIFAQTIGQTWLISIRASVIGIGCGATWGRRASARPEAAVLLGPATHFHPASSALMPPIARLQAMAVESDPNGCVVTRNEETALRPTCSVKPGGLFTIDNAF